jgi:3-(methylthio)propanoyl-CoA dehydrogenase
MIDLMHKGDAAAAAAAARVDLLTPLVKAYATDMAVDTASLGVQVHGGMGFIEETGAAQFYRDARILPIYEGTNGIQSNDLMFRKLLRDGGAEAQKFLGEMKAFATALKGNDDIAVIASGLTQAIAAVEKTTAWALGNAKADMDSVAASAQPCQRQFSLVACGYMMALAADAAQKGLADNPHESDFFNAKLVTARFFAESVLPQVHGLTSSIIGGNKTAVQMMEEWF